MTLYLNCIDNPITWNKKNYLLYAAKKLNLDVRDLKGENADYVLNIEPYEFKKGAKWTGIWEIDLLLDRSEMQEENWKQADVVFTAISTIPERLMGFKTQLLFQACEPDIHKRLPIQPEYDVIFCGSSENPCYEERRRLNELLKQNFSFNQYEKNQSLKGYVEICNRAKVQFIRSMKTRVANGELAQRFFEGLAIGPVLTNYVEDLEYTGLIEGTDYLAYRNDAEMMSNIDYLINHPSEAEKIAENGRSKALKYHTYEKRLEEICKLIPKNI